MSSHAARGSVPPAQTDGGPRSPASPGTAASPGARAATLTVSQAEALIADAFDPIDPGAASVGLEIEWVVIDPSDPRRPVGADEVGRAFAGPLPGGGTIGTEPGGQLELQTAPHPSAHDALAAADADEVQLRRRGEAGGLALLAVGTDPVRVGRRSVDQPRYRCMETALDARGPGGRAMMCSTAALQVNVDFGPDPLATWRRAGLVGPVLAAAFANSPFREGRRSAVASSRAEIWSQVDPTRTRPVPTGSVRDWQDYALDANVLSVGKGHDAVALTEPFTLRDWLRHGHERAMPDAGDVAEHLTTLFPPIRPRRWIECRFFDALPAADRRVAVLAVVTLLSEIVDLEALDEACRELEHPWERAARGLSDPALRRAAGRCLSLAAEALDRTDGWGASLVGSWNDVQQATGRTPADRTVDELTCDRHSPCPQSLQRMVSAVLPVPT